MIECGDEMGKTILILGTHDVVIYHLRLELIERFLADGHDVHISVPNGDWVPDLVALGTTYHEIRLNRRGMNPMDEWRIYRDYQRLMKEVRPDYITHATRKLMEKYGLEHIRVHDLRHTAGTLLSTRATMKQVQEFLGHEDISTTANTYVHLLDEDRKTTSNIMDSILKKSGFCSEKCSEPAGGQ